ncbi:T9SS type A sorting domain-containing protein [Fulvivirga sp. M361]|uniref:discoidin domain-containing protein n=1 Tax=Fulvivirga sp. M361 TaxID=2594266 RepID=UPI00117B1C82|nr:discoidin domain-containing protein [Fulvivirga sp. M361]TRX60748.1 T9SS type A sorting domain-containing protein [Fulvivirga sp. M361]
MYNKNVALKLKGGLIVIILLMISPLYQLAQAQDIFQLMQDDDIKVKKLERKGDRYFKNRDKGKGSGYKLYMRNLYWAKRNADANGEVISQTQVLDECHSFQSSWDKRANRTSQRVQSSSEWKELGPFNWTRTRSWSPGLGRIVSIAVEPTEQQIIYAGSPGGGIWKTVDAGRSWRPLGDDMVNMFIWSIAIDPNNSNTVFLGNSAGQIMKSIDGGNSWSEIYRVSGTPRRILIHPNSNIIFIGTTRSLYRSQNGGGSFSRVMNAKAEDVEFKPGNTNVVYACGDRFYRSTNGGASFSRITSGIVANERMKLAVTPANPNIVYLVQKRGSGFGRLYRSLDGGSSFSVRADYNSVSTRDVYFTQAARDMAITVSNTNANEVHLGGMNYSRSLDGGVSFNTMAAWNQPNDRSYVHADIEVLQYINGVIYFGTDGGIFRSTDRGNNCADLTQGGLAVRQYYRIGGAATDANMIVGGAQDNGTNIMNGANRQFKEWLGADGMECFIDHKNKNVVYGTVQFGSLYKSTDGGNSIGSISKPGDFRGEWVTPFSMDPINNNTIYVGYGNLYKSNNGGRSGSWRNITSSISIGGNLDEMAIAASNNNYIYIANGGRVWRTKNGQNSNPSWTEVSNFSGTVNYIAVDPKNPERVAIAASGSRVYLSTNAGNVWTNIRGNLPNISAQCLVFDDTDVKGLYVGMQSGVYYTNDDLNEWVPFSTNLPGVLTSELEIHYPTRKIRVATYGRGIWESDLYDAEGNAVSAPSNLTAMVNSKSVSLTWQDNASNENGFSLERSNGGAYQVITNLTANVQAYTDEDLSGGTYTYRIRAWDATNYSDYSNTVQVVIDDVVTPPDVLEDCTGCVVYGTDSEETTRAEQGKEKAVDGDPDTYWHTNWYDDETTHPHYISIDLGRQRDLVGFSYLGRQTGTTGMVKDYQLFGWDGANWQQLSTGSFQKSTLKQTVDFNKFRCRYVYFRALSEVDGKRWTSVAEFAVRYTTDENARVANETDRASGARPMVDLSDFDGLKVFPVPFEDQLNIKGITSKKVIHSMKLISVGGKVDKPRIKMNNDVVTIDTRELSSGLYILHFEENGVIKKLKVVKR